MCEFLSTKHIKQYQNRGNASNKVQSHFGSTSWKRLESGNEPLVPWGFDPACWGLNQLPPSHEPSRSLESIGMNLHWVKRLSFFAINASRHTAGGTSHLIMVQYYCLTPIPPSYGTTLNQLLPVAGQMFKAFWDRSEKHLFPWSNRHYLKRVSNLFKNLDSTSSTQVFQDNYFLSIFGYENSELAATAWHAVYVLNSTQVENRHDCYQITLAKMTPAEKVVIIFVKHSGKSTKHCYFNSRIAFFLSWMANTQLDPRLD